MEYTGWKNFKSVIRKETGLNSASEIAEGSGHKDLFKEIVIEI